MRSPRSARDDNFSKQEVVRSARPEGKRCRHMTYDDMMFLKVDVNRVSADFMNNSGLLITRT